MYKKSRRRGDRQGTQAEISTNLRSNDKASTWLDNADRALNDPQDSTEHTVVYLGWFRLSRMLDSDFEPYGRRSRSDGNPADCSCGCRYFAPLAPTGLSQDWGCCVNKKSPRAGLLTFEHQGCREFERGAGVSG
jgi:hypothetical protein